MNLVKHSDDLFVPEDFGKHHHYYADAEGKKEYTGITTVIGVLAKPALIGWAAKMACESIYDKWTSYHADHDGFYDDMPKLLEEAKSAHTKKKEAAGVHGTDAHALVEEWINGALEGKVIVDEKFLPIAPFITWATENVDHFLFAERRMAHAGLFLAGTADFAYMGKDGKRYMGDFKTSSGIYGIDYWLQVAAYRLLAEGEGDAPYDGAVIVRLGKKGPEDFEVQYLYEYESMRDAFLACLTLYRAQASIKGLTVH